MSTRRRPTKIDLKPADVAEVQQRVALLREKERELRSARESLNWVIFQATGVDLGKENWTLDIDHWSLSKES